MSAKQLLNKMKRGKEFIVLIPGQNGQVQIVIPDTMVGKVDDILDSLVSQRRSD